MNVTIFSKKQATKEGKTFYRYLAKLAKKDGTTITASVKFRESAGNPDPKDCPMVIGFKKEDANISEREFIREDTGEIIVNRTLWVSKWWFVEEYVDHSLDDFE